MAKHSLDARYATKVSQNVFELTEGSTLSLWQCHSEYRQLQHNSMARVDWKSKNMNDAAFL